MAVTKSATRPAAGAQSEARSEASDTPRGSGQTRSATRTSRSSSGSSKATTRSAKGSTGMASGTTRKSTRARKPADLPFGKGDYVVYPSHGVGQVTGIEKTKIAEVPLHLFVVYFASEKMTLRVPVDKASASGLRKIISPDQMQVVITTLEGRPRAKRSMWSRRAQEYEAKINSGDPIAVAEVVRDLFRAQNQQEQSYSERQMYESALDRLVRELALVEELGLDEATTKVETILENRSGRT